MPAKAKRTKGQAISLNDFNGPVEAETNDWAEDPWVPEQGEAGEGGAKGGLYAHGINKHLGDFRSDEQAMLSTIVPEDMEAPYTAHVGNLAHGITEEEVKEGFSPMEIINIRIIKTKATFAFVEFDCRADLQAAVLLSDKYVKGRPIKVDVATKQQQERMMAQQNGTATGNAGTFADLSRDAIGSSQQPTWDGDGMRGGRGGDRQPREPAGELSRDVFGGTQADFKPEGGRGDRGDRGDRGERGGFGGGGGGFGDFDRDAMGSTKQPEFRGMGGEGRGERRSRGTPKASPNSQDAPSGGGGFGSWRDDGAPVAQPKNRDGNNRGDRKPREDSKKKENEGEKQKDEEESGWRSAPQVKQPVQTGPPKPTVNMWNRSSTEGTSAAAALREGKKDGDSSDKKAPVRVTAPAPKQEEGGGRFGNLRK